MVEINNQRKAFLDMLAWSEELITDVKKTRNHGYDVIAGGELFTDYSDHPLDLSRKPKANQQAPDATASFPLVGCPPQAAWPERLLSKSQDAVALQQIKERGALPMIDLVISVNRPLQQYLGFTAGRWFAVSSSMGWPSVQNSKKRAERSERLMYEQSHRDYLRLWLSASSSCLSWAVNHYNAITKPSATKMPENWSWRTQQLLTCRCVSVMLLRSMQKYTKELADAKAENALRDDVAAGRRRGCASKQSVSQCVKPTASGVDNATSDWRISAERDYFTLKRGWSLCKNNWKEPRSILMSSADRVAHIDGPTQPVKPLRASSGV